MGETSQGHWPVRTCSRVVLERRLSAPGHRAVRLDLAIAGLRVSTSRARVGPKVVLHMQLRRAERHAPAALQRTKGARGSRCAGGGERSFVALVWGVAAGAARIWRSGALRAAGRSTHRIRGYIPDHRQRGIGA